MTIHQPTTLNRGDDYYSEFGAGMLAACIRSYWNRRGFHPNVWIEKQLTIQSPAANERITYIVKSDMLNGRPQ